MRRAMTIPMLAVLGMCLGWCLGCNDFERTTYQTLSATKTTVDQIAADYNAKKIPNSEAAYKAVTALRAAQTTAVQAMVEYETIKAAKGSSSALAAQQQIVANALTALPPLIAAAKALYTSVTSQNEEQSAFEAKWGSRARADYARAASRMATNTPPAVYQPFAVQ